MSPGQSEFVAHCTELLGSAGMVRSRRMFGGHGFYVDDLFVALISAECLYLKVDAQTRPAFEAAGCARFVYDGDSSADPEGPVGPPGSAQIESIFTDYFDSKGLASEPTEFSGRSDYGPFIAVGIPAGGLFSGAEGIKTASSDEKITREFADEHLRIGIDSLHQLINRGLTVKHLRF